MEVWDTYIPHKLGDTTADYARWKAAVAAVRDLPEYKLRKLWKANFSPADIAADKHWALYPPQRISSKLLRARTEPTSKLERGRNIGAKRKAWLYSMALRNVAQAILTGHSLDAKMRAETEKELARFEELTKLYAHKKS